MKDATKRFSDRVDNYIKYRPGYPTELLQALLEKSGLGKEAVIADIGSGTGILTRLLLELNPTVIGVEPNANMREAAESLLSDYPGFTSIDAPAEQTGLDDDSVDLITAAQAFHWFNNAETKSEFRRILKPDGKLALIWNRRDVNQPFQQAYDAILKIYAPEYGVVNHMNLTEADLAGFFSPGQMEVSRYDYSQQLTFADLLGRLKSSSYCPPESSPQYPSLVAELAAPFEQFALNGKIDFQYQTELYFGPMGQ